MLGLMIEWQLSIAVMIVGASLTLVFGLVVGHRIHYWLWFFVPSSERLIPADTGASLGLSFAVLALLL